MTPFYLAALLLCTNHLSTVQSIDTVGRISGNNDNTNHNKNVNLRGRRASATTTAPTTTTPFADIFPEKSFILDMATLSKDITFVDTENGVSPADVISDPKFQFEAWIEAEHSTEAMIVSTTSYNEDENDLGKKVVLIFRGSEELEDWITNSQIVRVQSKFIHAPEDVTIHCGFQTAMFDQGVVDFLEGKLMELIGIDSFSGEVYLTGHSLGGANAHMMATYLADKYPNITATMLNFGAPRLGNEAFKTWSEGTVTNLAAWRFVNGRDVVPRLIPNSIGYDHAGHLFQIWKDDYAEVFYRQTGDGSNYAGAPWSWYYGTSAIDHFMANYVKHFTDEYDNDVFWPTSFAEKGFFWRQIGRLGPVFW